MLQTPTRLVPRVVPSAGPGQAQALLPFPGSPGTGNGHEVFGTTPTSSREPITYRTQNKPHSFEYSPHRPGVAQFSDCDDSSDRNSDSVNPLQTLADNVIPIGCHSVRVFQSR